MVRILEIYPEHGDKKVIVKVDDEQLDRAQVRIERDGESAIEAVETLKRDAA